MAEGEKQVRRADLKGLADYLFTKKGIVREQQTKINVVVSERQGSMSKSEACSGPLKSGITIFK